MTEQLMFISIEEIDIPIENSYKEDDISDLKFNIARNKIITPIGVYLEDDGRYKVTNGSRRVRAVKELVEEGREDLRKIPAYVKFKPDTESEKNDQVASGNFFSREKDRITDFEEFKRIYIRVQECVVRGDINSLGEIEAIKKRNPRYRKYEEILMTTVPEFIENYLQGKMEFNILDQIHNLNRAQQKALLAELTSNDEEYDENYIKEFDRKWSESAELDSEDIPYNEVGDRPYFNKPQYEFIHNVEDSFKEPVISDYDAGLKDALERLHKNKSEETNDQTIDENENFDDLYNLSMVDEDYDLDSVIKKEEKEKKKIQELQKHMEQEQDEKNEKDCSQETFLDQYMLIDFENMSKLLNVVYYPYIFKEKRTFISRKKQDQIECLIDVWLKDGLKLLKSHNTHEELLEICRSNDIDEKVLSN